MSDSLDALPATLTIAVAITMKNMTFGIGFFVTCIPTTSNTYE